MLKCVLKLVFFWSYITAHVFHSDLRFTKIWRMGFDLRFSRVFSMTLEPRHKCGKCMQCLKCKYQLELLHNSTLVLFSKYSRTCLKQPVGYRVKLTSEGRWLFNKGKFTITINIWNHKVLTFKNWWLFTTGDHSHRFDGKVI